MLEMEENAYTNPMFDYGDEYKIIGLPFYNEEHRRKEFGEAIEKWISNL